MRNVERYPDTSVRFQRLSSPPLQPIVPRGNNAIMATAEERPVSHPSNSQDLMWPQDTARVTAPQSSCSSSRFSCKLAKHQKCVHENLSNIINIPMSHSLMWVCLISPNHRCSESLLSALRELLLKVQTVPTGGGVKGLFCTE